jgi:hypothetical protein
MSLITSKNWLVGVMGLVVVTGFVSHGGSQDGARSFLTVNADTGRAFAWMTNYERIPRDFQAIVSQALTEQLTK